MSNSSGVFYLLRNRSLFYSIHNGFKSFGMVHGEVGQYFTAHLYILFMEFPHKL